MFNAPIVRNVSNSFWPTLYIKISRFYSKTKPAEHWPYDMIAKFCAERRKQLQNIQTFLIFTILAPEKGNPIHKHQVLPDTTGIVQHLQELYYGRIRRGALDLMKNWKIMSIFVNNNIISSYILLLFATIPSTHLSNYFTSKND